MNKLDYTIEFFEAFREVTKNHTITVHNIFIGSLQFLVHEAFKKRTNKACPFDSLGSDYNKIFKQCFEFRFGVGSYKTCKERNKKIGE